MQIFLFFTIIAMFIATITMNMKQDQDHFNSKAKTIAQQIAYYHNLAVKQCSESVHVTSNQSATTGVFNLTTHSTACSPGIVTVEFPEDMQSVRDNYNNFVSVYVAGDNDNKVVTLNALQDNDSMTDAYSDDRNALRAAGDGGGHDLPIVPARNNEANQGYIITFWNPHISDTESSYKEWQYISGLVAGYVKGNNQRTFSGTWDTSVSGFYRDMEYTLNYASPYNTSTVDPDTSVIRSSDNTPYRIGQPIVYHGSGAASIANGAPGILSYSTTYRTDDRYDNQSYPDTSGGQNLETFTYTTQ